MELTYVYAMRNSRNGYIKIGRSDSPRFREKTLQSEEPEVELLFAYLCRPEVESMAHMRYDVFRLRGEWFDLPGVCIVTLQDMLQEESDTLYFSFTDGTGDFMRELRMRVGPSIYEVPKQSVSAPSIHLVEAGNAS